MTVDAEAFTAVMGQWPSGVTVVTTTDADGHHGMTASSFSSVSLDPPLVSVCIAKDLHTHERLQSAGVFAVNILDREQVEIGQRFAGMMPDVDDRFEGIETATAESGAPLLPETLGWVDCRIWQAYDGGDHTIFVGEVLAAGTSPEASPLLYHSRAWGVFADVLAADAQVTAVGTELSPKTRTIPNAFGESPVQPSSIDELVVRVRQLLSDANGDIDVLILDDAASAADPVLIKWSLRALSGLVGRTQVCLRAGAGPMALANVLVALKSGVNLLQASDANPAYVPMRDVLEMLARTGVTAHTQQRFEPDVPTSDGVSA